MNETYSEFLLISKLRWDGTKSDFRFSSFSFGLSLPWRWQSFRFCSVRYLIFKLWDATQLYYRNKNCFYHFCLNDKFPYASKNKLLRIRIQLWFCNCEHYFVYFPSSRTKITRAHCTLSNQFWEKPVQDPWLWQNE